MTDRLERGHEALGRSSNPNPSAGTWRGLETPALQEGATCQPASPAPALGGVHARVPEGSEPGGSADDPGKKGAAWGLGPGLSLACGAQGGSGASLPGPQSPRVSREQSYSNEQGPGSLGSCPCSGELPGEQENPLCDCALPHQDREMQNTRYF